MSRDNQELLQKIASGSNIAIAEVLGNLTSRVEALEAAVVRLEASAQGIAPQVALLSEAVETLSDRTPQGKVAAAPVKAEEPQGRAKTMWADMENRRRAEAARNRQNARPLPSPSESNTPSR